MAQADSQGGPLDRLKAEAGSLVEALAQRVVDTARGKVENATGRLTEYVAGGAGPGVVSAVTGAKDLAEGKSPARSFLGAGVTGLKERVSGLFGKGNGKGGGTQKLKLTNIVESVDVGVPVRVAYNQWTEFQQFPTFMKKVENVEQTDDRKLNWKAQVFWSHRSWEATILQQRPDEQIVWRSTGQKGHVDGAVTFHELAPGLTRIVLIMEYHPHGLFERTGNVWRAQGRRVRLELKQFARHVMTSTVLHPDETEGWRGTIEDGKVVKDHDSARQEEEDAGSRRDETATNDGAGDEAGERGDSADQLADETPADDDQAADEDQADDDQADDDQADDDQADDDQADDDQAADDQADTETGGTRGRRAAPRRPRVPQQASRSGDKPRSATRSGTRSGTRGGDRS